MKNMQKPVIEIVYKNDEEARNKFVKFIINLILENNDILGEIDVSRSRTDKNEGDGRHDI